MTQQEVMKTFMQSLNETEKSGRSALDEAIKASSNFGSYQEVVSKFYADRQEAGNWHTFLVRYCGIILDNADTGAISGSDAGGATAKGATDILPSEGDTAYPEGSSFTVDGLTIYGIPPKEELTEDQQYVVQGLYSWWLRDALALIKESYGLTFTDDGTTNMRLKLHFYEEEGSGTLTYVSFTSLNGTLKEYESYALAVNMAQFKNMSWSDRHGSVGVINLDRILVHELVHSLMASNVNYLGDLPGAIVEGATAEIIHGIDDMRYQELIYYAKNIDEATAALSTEIMLSNSVYAIYTCGYMFMRYFLKQAADTTFDYDTYQKKISVDDKSFATNYWDEVKITGSSNADTITNSGEKVSINAKDGADTIKNYSDYVTIKGGAGNDSIYNDGSDVKIDSGSGNDTINNAGISVAIKAALGNDLIYNEEVSSDTSIYGGIGNDSVHNYGTDIFILGDAGNDSINNYGVSASVIGGKGNDTIENRGTNSTVHGDKDNDIITNYGAESFIYGDFGKDSISNAGDDSEIYGGIGNDSLENSGANSAIYGDVGKDYFKNDGDTSTLYGGSGKDNFVNYGDGVYIIGGADNDSIYNCGAWTELDGDVGKDYFNNEGTAVYIAGGAGNDKIYNYGDHVSISGDGGNDYIENSGGKHITYNFGEDSGNDTVIGFNANDTIKITSGGYSTAESGNDVIVTVGNASLLLKDALDLEINFIDESENNLSAIVNNDLDSITLDELETSTAKNFLQNTLLAYSDK